MGCGTSKKRKEESDEKGKQGEQNSASKLPSKVPTDGLRTPNLVPETEQQSMPVARQDDGTCAVCKAADPHKVSFLDCTHGLCVACIKKQLSGVLKSKDDEVNYQCSICKAPKPLSIGYPKCPKNHEVLSEDLTAIYGPKARWLELYRAKVTDELLVLLSTELNKDKSLTDLAVDQGDFRQATTAPVDKFVQDLKHVRTLSLRCAKFAKPAFEGLCAGLKATQRLVSLDLYGVQLSTEFVGLLAAALATNFSLETLDLGGNPLEDEAIQQLCTGYLKKTQKLTQFSLGGSRLSPKAMLVLCECLASLATLKSLSFQKLTLTLEHCQALAKVLESSGTLKSVNISETSPTREAWIELAKGVIANKEMRKLEIEANKMGSSALEVLVDCLSKHKQLRKLTVAENSLDESAGLLLGTIAATSRTLKQLSVRYNFLGPVGVGKLLGALQANATLKVLNIRKNKVTKEGATAIAKFLREPSALENLIANDNLLEDAGGAAVLLAVQDNKSLLRLDLGQNALAGETASAAAQALASNKTLRHLILDNNLLNDDAAKTIAGSLSKAKGILTLNLINNPIVKDGIAALKQALAHIFPALG